MDMRSMMNLVAQSVAVTESDEEFGDIMIDEGIEGIVEKAPPGKKAGRFIEKHKKEFKKRYGDAWERVLYATAWKNFG